MDNAHIMDNHMRQFWEQLRINCDALSPFCSSPSSAYSPFTPDVTKEGRNGVGENEKGKATQAFFGPDFTIPHALTNEINSLSLLSQSYSKKVFIGGIPAGTNQDVLHANFSKFGRNQIDWPKKTPFSDSPPDGYAFVVFEDESSVYKLLQLCVQNDKRTTYYLQNTSNHLHPVEIKIWELKNAYFVGTVGWRKYKRYSVFVGGLPRTCSAEYLANVLEEMIGCVAYCTIEQDKLTQYPKGAACVVFCSRESYIKAIAVHEILLRFTEGDRKVELKSFLTPNMSCEKCGAVNGGTKFCNEMICLAYYCDDCWKSVHNQHRPGMASHVALKKARSKK